jgi:metal-responsive CopG/Arc/MetJ family transcriptional regulator
MMREVMLMRAHYWAGRMETTRTTVALPTRLLERVNAAVDSGAVPNRNIAIADALEAYLDDIERQEIDQQFALLAEDESYRQLNEELAEEFAEADWQALLKGEGKQ